MVGSQEWENYLPFLLFLNGAQNLRPEFIWMDFFVFSHEHQYDRKFSILMKSEFWQEKNLASLPLPRSNDPSIINTQT